MKFGPDSYSHDECCSQGHSSASKLFTLKN
ncbi:hypothetical protein FHT71_004529 [Rhizobium sp. BK060]|nr:hypothetical protein [Rhizobium sp. BK060]